VLTNTLHQEDRDCVGVHAVFTCLDFSNAMSFWLASREPMQSRGVRCRHRRRRLLAGQVGAIDLNLCTYVPLVKSNSQTKFCYSLILGLASRGPKPKTLKVLLIFLRRKVPGPTYGNTA
jgi:hypothetical protein